MTFRPFLAALAAGLLALTCGASSGSAAAKAPAPAWIQARSDVPADPQVRFGILPNGMRYAIQHNATPTGQASLRMWYDVGSLMETDAEQGLAHFLEHMSFNGSRNVPEGDMVKTLERHGLAFGADTNAQTSWTQTVYQLDLPTTDEDTVDTALMLLREGASRLTLNPGAIDRERGVVLSEERARDTPGYRVFKAGLGFFLQGQLAARRLPIGKVKVIETAGHDLIDHFYRQYYRPDRAVLVAVGDFDVDSMEKKIKAEFSDWTPEGPAGPAPDLGHVAPRGVQTRLFVEPGAPLTIQMEWLQPADRSLDTLARRRTKLYEQLALAVLNRRLDRLARSDAPPFIAAQAYKGDFLHSAEAATVTLAAKPGQWRPALSSVEQEQRRIVEYGVGQDELDREIAELRVQYQAAAAQAATRKTTQIANDIAASLDDRTVYDSPAEDLREFEADVKGLKAAQIDATAKQIFSGQGPLVFMASPDQVEGGDKALAEAFAASRAKPVSAPAEQKLMSWPYSSFGPPGQVAEQKTIEDLGTTFVRFRNGVRLTVKPTRFRDDQVLVRVRIGHGLLDLPKDRVSTAWASAGFTDGGLKALTAEQMERILASNIYGADFSTSEDAFLLQGRTRPEDLAVQLQVLAAYTADPGFRPEAFRRMKTYVATLNQQMQATPSGVLGRDLSRLMHGGDPRFAFPSQADIAASTADEFHDLLRQPLASGPIEVLIVGDIPLDKAIALTASTFGALPPRSDAPAPAGARALSLPAPDAQPLVLTHKGRADQAIAYAEWPTDDFFSDPQRARTLRVLAQVIELRLIDDLREAKGVTYSPNAGADASLVFPHYGYVSAVVEIPPGKIDDFYRDLDKISADLREHPVSADELERAKKPLIESLSKSRQTNEYWLQQLSGAQADPRKLDALRTVQASLAKVDAADIQAAARAYLEPGKLWRLQITPEGKSPLP